mmetsp:Transcript_39419/g.93319  ORF Transcript_39419/g.93319 Transcript_39419/m.93319 type:complete len:384 (-) Transcript_39419:147-1298(-)
MDVFEEVQCCICHKISDDPRQCKEGDLFCLACVTSYCKRKVVCPGHCGTTLSLESLARNKAAEGLINKFFSACTNRVSGCQWRGKPAELHHHLELCGFVQEECRGCEKVLFRSNVQAHRSKCFKLALLNIKDVESKPDLAERLCGIQEDFAKQVSELLQYQLSGQLPQTSSHAAGKGETEAPRGIGEIPEGSGKQARRIETEEPEPGQENGASGKGTRQQGQKRRRGSWVRCDECKKWRKVPPEAKIDLTEPFFCYMLAAVTCDTAEEKWPDGVKWLEWDTGVERSESAKREELPLKRARKQPRAAFFDAGSDFVPSVGQRVEAEYDEDRQWHRATVAEVSCTQRLVRLAWDEEELRSEDEWKQFSELRALEGDACARAARHG